MQRIGQEDAHELAAACAEDAEANELVRCATRGAVQQPIGEVGSRVRHDDKIRATVQKYAPWVVRGHHGDDGLYEEYYRTEPHIFQAVNTVTGMLTAGTHMVEMPGEVKESQQSAVREFVDWCNGWLHGVRHSSPGGLGSFMAHAASAQIFGFALHETVWAKDDQGRWRPDAYLFREQNTLDRWILGDREAELVATQHEGVGMEAYTLPAGGPTQDERRVTLSSLHARGNNFEGISLIRPAIHWIKTKRILGQILAVAADKYGAPITAIKKDPNFTRQAMGSADGAGDESDETDLFEVFKHLRAVDGAVATIPGGLDVEIKSPKGAMPTLGDMIRYCDEMISLPWSNQGSTLSSGTVGSYALAKVEDQKFVRAVPPIHQAIVRPINDQIRYLAKRYLEGETGELLAYPTVGYHLDHVTDTSAWIEDMTKLMGGQPLTRWPEPLQKKALDRMDLDEDLLEEANTPTPQTPGGVKAPEQTDTPEEAQ